MTDLRNSKQSIIEMLELWSSREKQLEYQRSVPIADVSAELFCMWDEVFWTNDSALRAEFTEGEWAALEQFHSVVERALRLLPHHPLPPIEQFILSPHWLIVSRDAERALTALNSTPH